MALYIPHSILHLARLLYVRPETFWPYYVRRKQCNITCIWHTYSILYAYYHTCGMRKWTCTRYALLTIVSTLRARKLENGVSFLAGSGTSVFPRYQTYSRIHIASYPIGKFRYLGGFKPPKPKTDHWHPSRAKFMNMQVKVSLPLPLKTELN